MNRLSLKAAIIGGLINFIGFPVAVLIITMMITGTVIASAISETPRGSFTTVVPAFNAHVHALASPLLVLMTWLIVAASILVDIAAGYIAGRIAGHDRVLNGAASSGLSIIFALGMTFVSRHDPSMRSLLTIFVQGPLLCALGGYLSTLGRVNAPAPAE